MRNIFLFVLFLLISESIYSKVITVGQNGIVPAQFNDIRQALSSASSGDTIYYQGFAPSVSLAVTNPVNKKIIIIGNGFNSVLSNIELVNGSSGTVISNIQFNEIYLGGSNTNNVIVQNCDLSTITNIGNNALIRNNIIRKVIRLENSENVIISNNIFQCLSDLNHIGGIKTSNKSNVIIKNNYFSKSEQGNAFDNVSNAKIYNNIFRTVSPAGASNCEFNNNLTYQTNQNTIPYGNNTGIKNIINQDPKVTNEVSTKWTEAHDLKLKDDSPGKKAGLDDEDIGIYGGQFPWKDFPDKSPNYTGKTLLPNVTELKILLDPVGINSNLRFEVQGKSPNKKP